MSDKRQVKTNAKSGRNQSSRRGFLGQMAAGAAAGALASQSVAKAQPEGNPLPVPKAVEESLSAPIVRADFTEAGMTGAQVFANLCKDEGLAALFCAAGNYTVINEIAQVGIPCYGGRTEGGMCAAADDFSRVTGEVVACSGTEGPGFTHMIMNIASAHFSNSALLVLASNTDLAAEDRQRGVQFMYQQPVTEGIKKWGKRITVPGRVYEYGAYAFRNLKSGVPDVVHLDFPSDVAMARFQNPSNPDDFYNREQYRSEARAYPGSKDVQRTIEMIDKAERPVLIAGHGVFVRKGCDALMQAAERHEMAVVSSGPVRGHFPDEHRLSGSMSNDALMSADLVVFVGQYSMPSPSEWTLPPGVKTIRVHPVQEDLGRNWPVDLGIVSDEQFFMEALANGLPSKKRDAWVGELAAARRKHEKTELDNCAKYKLPVICVVYNNDCWGTFTMASNAPRALHRYLFHETYLLFLANGMYRDYMSEQLGVSFDIG